MTEEEMADWYIQNDAVFVNNKATIKSVKLAFLAGLEAGRPKWHNLRKNPDDLPDDEREVLQQGGVWVMYINGHWRYVNGEKWEDDAHVYAWIDIPVFLEGEDA